MKQLTEHQNVRDLTVSGNYLPVQHQEHQSRVSSYLEQARARNTIRGYRSSFQLFTVWCQANHYPFLPASAESIAAYLTDQAGSRNPTGQRGTKVGGLKVSTLRHHLAAIQKAHKAAGLPSPAKDSLLISETLKGIASVHGSATKQKSPILTEDLRDMLRKAPGTLIGTRNRALLLIGFVGAFRRSELAAIEVSDLKFGSSGLLIHLRRSKSDQEGEGRDVAIPYGSRSETCPVTALQAWLKAASIETGPVFRSINRHEQISAKGLSDHSINEIVKEYAGAIGQDAANFGGHSLRAGFVTSAARAGEPERKIMRQTGHKSIEMVLRYVRQANAFTDNAVLALGL